MVSTERRQRAVLHPSKEELGVGVAFEPADVGTDEGLAGDPETGGHRQADPEVLPVRQVVAHPVRGIPLYAGKPGARQHEGPLAWDRVEQTGRGAHRHQQRVLVVEALV